MEVEDVVGEDDLDEEVVEVEVVVVEEVEVEDELHTHPILHLLHNLVLSSLRQDFIPRMNGHTSLLINVSKSKT